MLVKVIYYMLTPNAETLLTPANSTSWKIHWWPCFTSTWCNRQESTFRFIDFFGGRDTLFGPPCLTPQACAT